MAQHNFSIIPNFYYIKLCTQANRKKARAFAEYCVDLDQRQNHSLRFYQRSWGHKSVSTAKAWIDEFHLEIQKYIDAQYQAAELKKQKILEIEQEKNDRNTTESFVSKKQSNTNKKNRTVYNEPIEHYHIDKNPTTSLPKETKSYTSNYITEQSIYSVSSSNFNTTTEDLLLEEFLAEKSKNKNNPLGYQFSIKKKIQEGEKSYIDEFEFWKSKKEMLIKNDFLISLLNFRT